MYKQRHRAHATTPLSLESRSLSATGILRVDSRQLRTGVWSGSGAL